jgi:hypothetical protein
MADLLRELTTWIADQTGLRIGGGTAVRDDDRLFAGHIPPDKPDTGALVRETGGPDQFLRGGFAEIGQGTFQVIARGPSHFAARELAWTIHAALHGAVYEVLGAHTLHVAEALARPQFLGLDERGRHLFSTNYRINAHDQSLATP